MKTLTLCLLAALAAIPAALVASPALSHGNHAKHSAETPFGHPGKTAKVTRTVAVAMSDTMRFDPETLTVKQGETLRLHITNTGKIDHEFVLGDKAELQEHADMMKQMPGMKHTDANAVSVAPGKSGDIVWTFSKAGNFLYACLVPGHWEAGMEGHLAVKGKSRN